MQNTFKINAFHREKSTGKLNDNGEGAGQKVGRGNICFM